MDTVSDLGDTAGLFKVFLTRARWLGTDGSCQGRRGMGASEDGIRFRTGPQYDDLPLT
jgi:hypothetical protein